MNKERKTRLLNAQMSPLTKASIMRGLNVLHFVAIVGLFVLGWHLFYRIPAMEGDYRTNSPVVSGTGESYRRY